MKRPIYEATRRRLAVKAWVDPRTLDKVLAGKAVRGMAGHRARAVLEAEGVPFPPAPSRGAAGASRPGGGRARAANTPP